MSQKQSHARAIKVNRITYEIPGGIYYNTKFTWACVECGKVWFSREVAVKCTHKSTIGYNKPLGYMITPRMEKVLAILDRCETKAEAIRIANLNVETFMKYAGDKRAIVEFLKKKFH